MSDEEKVMDAFKNAGKPALPDSENTGSKEREQFFRDLLGQNFSSFSDILMCPSCHNKNLILSGDKIKCGECKHQFLIDGNILDLKV